MMQIDLTPEIESALRAEASASGLSPADLTLQVLADYTRRHSATGDLAEKRRLAAQRIAHRADASDAPRLNLPEGLSIRDWLHAGHRY